ncbi:MAG: hypothetical protein VKQ33_02615 [Candidatus Sericytochromatia bacterium]|nr:hypothetical protein [Candidatus Sericytochromatia bacterium]
MKRAAIALALAACLAPGCGWYTNLPASVYVAAVKPGKVTYEAPNAQGVREVKTEPPVVTFHTEPGSIGVNFELCRVTYTPASSLLPKQEFGLSFRVEAAGYPTQPRTGRIEQGQVGQFVEVGKVEVEVPVLTRHVEAYGLDASTNAPMITAVTEFLGTDDATWQVPLTARIPIYFLGQPGSR